MNQQNTDRKTFINKYRRENRWAIPFLAFGTVAMIAAPVLLGTTTLGLAGAALLTALFVYGIVRSLNISRGGDNDVLRNAGERELGVYALLTLGVVLFSLGNDLDPGWVVWTGVILFTIQGNEKRVAQARAFLAGQNEKMSPVPS